MTRKDSPGTGPVSSDPPRSRPDPDAAGGVSRDGDHHEQTGLLGSVLRNGTLGTLGDCLVLAGLLGACILFVRLIG
jgi:hypothetical protein